MSDNRGQKIVSVIAIIGSAIICWLLANPEERSGFGPRSLTRVYYPPVMGIITVGLFLLFDKDGDAKLRFKYVCIFAGLNILLGIFLRF